ncbi:unnamed protein product [Microthlaspi erraticum]|uniref:Uncharacterized protein n=1 Tax=Microthlaspi erraticum TaxID=1685480 RepID=A0A6D2KYI6_9BRAS|nr:unnamed protein product [Microthlaspi erraticum]
MCTFDVLIRSFGANWNIAYHWRLVEEGKTLSAPCTDPHSVELVRCVRSIVSNEGFPLRFSLTSSWKLWIIELAFVWRWFHVIRTSGSEDTTILVGLDPPARPASFQLDRAAFQESKSNPKNVASL